MRSPPVFNGARATRSLVVCVCFVDRCLAFCTFSFGHGVVSLFRLTDPDYSFGIFKSSYIFILFLSFDMYGMCYKINFARIIKVLKFIN